MGEGGQGGRPGGAGCLHPGADLRAGQLVGQTAGRRAVDLPLDPVAPDPARSEEHTSELQSRENLVCRLLLEKKKKKQQRTLYKKKKKKKKLIEIKNKRI